MNTPITMPNPLAHNITINMMVYTRVAFVTIKAIQSDWHHIIFIGYSRANFNQNRESPKHVPEDQSSYLPDHFFVKVYILSGVLSSCTYIASMQGLPSYHNNITLQLIARVLKFTLLKVIVVITYMYA